VARLGTAIAEEQQRERQWQEELTAAVPGWRAALDALRGDG
jgi:hypothetical protein